MPPKPQIFGSSAFPLLRRSYVCPSCLSRRNTPRQKSGAARITTRKASTTSSVTAVNAPLSIPPAFKQLHQSLSALEHEASVYVNVSQLRLALRGLEYDNAITRVAVLGLNDQYGARRLVRALLADPLNSEPVWEKQIIESEDGDDRALLIRYGEQLHMDDRHPLVKTLSIPSPVLHSNNVEILVQSLKERTVQTDGGANDILVPSLEMTSAPSGKLSMVTYPVHKTLLYAATLKSLAPISQSLLSTGQKEQERMVKGVIDGSWSALQPGSNGQDGMSLINLALGEIAIETFRKSLKRSIEFEHAWFDSGLPTVSAWLSESTEVRTDAIKPPVRRLVELIHTTTSQAIQYEDKTKDQEVKAATVPDKSRQIIDQGISIWAGNAHTELRDRLNSAFVSKSWRKLKWWKLFWRVDEVGFVASEILQRAWLVEAEKEMIWISGRIYQSGLLGPPKFRPTSAPDPDESRLGREPLPPSVSDLVKDVTPFEAEDDLLIFHPWPQEISHARSALSRVAIPPLQALSQSLMLQTISTTFLTSSLSALLYVSVSTTSLYEAGTIGAVGLVYSLRQLQTRWESAKAEWKLTIRENGRDVLRRAEEQAREVVKIGGMGELDDAGVAQRKVAKAAVERVKRDLEHIKTRT